MANSLVVRELLEVVNSVCFELQFRVIPTQPNKALRLVT